MSPRPTSPKSIGKIEDFRFDNVSSKPSEQHTQCAVEQISFQVRKGETVAFVGPSGAGKNHTGKITGWFGTFPEQGKILYNGVPVIK